MLQRYIAVIIPCCFYGFQKSRAADDEGALIRNHELLEDLHKIDIVIGVEPELQVIKNIDFIFLDSIIDFEVVIAEI